MGPRVRASRSRSCRALPPVEPASQAIPGQYESYGAAAQLRYGLARWGALSLNYDYYVYRFENVVDLPSEFSAGL